MRRKLSLRTSAPVARIGAPAAIALLCLAGVLLLARAEAATTNVNVGQQNGGSLGSTQFNAAAIAITTGDTVHWQWFNGNHTVFSYDESSPGVPQWKTPGVLTMSGDTFDHVFNTAGTYTYYCSVHGFRDAASPANIDAYIAAGGMAGKIVVTAPPPVGGVASAPGVSASKGASHWYDSSQFIGAVIAVSTLSALAALVARRRIRGGR